MRLKEGAAPRRLRRYAALGSLMLYLSLAGPDGARASLIGEAGGKSAIGLIGLTLPQAPPLRRDTLSEICEHPAAPAAARHGPPAPAIPLATSLTPGDGLLLRGAETASRHADEASPPSNRSAVLDKIRQQIALIDSCQLHVERMLTRLRSTLLHDLGRETADIPVAYASSESSRHNLPGARSKTVEARQIANRRNAKPNANKSTNEMAKNAPTGWGISSITITITGFIVEVFSYAHTYIFIIAFGLSTLYFWIYLNRS